jgi:murein DD-endopeptidase MepM/ murein hydrolase activator NlpD
MSDEAMRAVLADPDAIEALHKAHGAYQSGELLKGEPVEALQEALIARGFALKVDGALGMKTGAAVAAFQHLSGLKVDGIVGTTTAKSLGIKPIPRNPGTGYFHPTGGVGSYGKRGRNDFGAPRGGGNRRHKGQDIMLANGKPLYAVTSGTVRWDKNKSAGIIVYLEGDDGHRYSYFHLSDREGSAGMRVTARQVIGHVGETGDSNGPHLHFEYRPRGGDQVDPMPFLSASKTA